MITVDRLDLFAPIDLASVVDSANLQTRIDSKYLLTPDAYGRFCDRLARLGDWRCLEIGGRRRFAYESIYFDTPELLTYRQHRQGRRHRFKVRSRTYADSGECAFEVKLKGARADTVKERMEYRAADAGRLAPDAAEFLAATLRRAYGMAVPLGMAPRVRTDYRRHTLVDLRCRHPDHVRRGAHGHWSHGPCRGAAGVPGRGQVRAGRRARGPDAVAVRGKADVGEQVLPRRGRAVSVAGSESLGACVQGVLRAGSARRWPRCGRWGWGRWRVRVLGQVAVRAAATERWQIISW